MVVAVPPATVRPDTRPAGSYVSVMDRCPGPSIAVGNPSASYVVVSADPSLATAGGRNRVGRPAAL